MSKVKISQDALLYGSNKIVNEGILVPELNIKSSRNHNIVRNSRLLVFPNIQSCTAMVVQLDNGDLYGFHLNTGCINNKDEMHGLFYFIESLGNVKAVYLVGSFGTYGQSVKLDTYRKDFKSFRGKIFGLQFKLATANDKPVPYDLAVVNDENTGYVKAYLKKHESESISKSYMSVDDIRKNDFVSVSLIAISF